MPSVHTRRGAPAAFFPQASVESGAGILLDAGAYKLDAGRRTAPGDVELHEHAVDVMHVIRGSATVVTGGELRDARDVGPGEIRARALDGGTSHVISAGDVLWSTWASGQLPSGWSSAKAGSCSRTRAPGMSIV